MATQKERLIQVLTNLVDGFREEYLDEDDAIILSNKLEYLLEELLGEDFFGTEGQLDPRGDNGL